MSLAALAAIGRSGSPLYLRDFAADSNLVFDYWGQGNSTDFEFFGCSSDDIPIEGDNVQSTEEWPCQNRFQFMLQAASDRMEQVLAGDKWKASGASGADACWVGFLCTFDNFNAYGYVTTNVRYISLIEDSIRPDDAQQQKARENGTKILMANVHRLYTENLLNPFSSPHSKITSKRFDSNVVGLVRNFNASNNPSY